MSGAILMGVVIGALLTGTGAFAQESPSATDEKSSFVEGTLGGLPNVNPFRGLTSGTYYVLSLQYDLPINFAIEDLSAAPGLVTEWSQSDDGLTWTLKTREGVTWQDGEPFTAHDVAFTFNTIIENGTGSFIDYFPYVTSMTAPDDTTVLWETDRPVVSPLLPPWVYILPQHIWEPLGDYKDMTNFDNFAPGQPTIGTGPFQLTQWERRESWTLTANPNYWGGAPQVDEIVVRQYNNTEAMVSALKLGEVDYISLSDPDLFEELQTEPGISTNVGPLTGFTQMSFNMCNPATTGAGYCERNPGTGHVALRDPIVRQAIAKAIDRQTLVDRVLKGYGEPGTVIVPPFAAQWHLEPAGDVQTFDPAAAQTLLDESGYVDTDGDGVRETPDGEPLSFRFFLRSEAEGEQTSGEFIKSWLEDIGVETTIQVGSTDDLTELWYDHDFDMYIWGWGPDPDPDFILSTFTSGQCGVWSDTCYSDPTYDDLYKSQQTATSLEERQAIIDQMQQQIWDVVPEVVLYYDATLEAYRSDEWEGLVLSPQPQGYLIGQYTPYSEISLRPAGTGGGEGDGGGGTVSTGGGDTGLPGWVWIALGGGVLAIVVIVAVVRRGKSEEDLA
jgi:peptide/nickel transport system substrate-binding protein